MSLVDDERVRQLIESAKREDLGSGDLSAGLLRNPQEPAVFHLIARQAGVLAGREVADAVLRAYDPQISIDWAQQAADGSRLTAVPVELAEIRGAVAAVLSAERVLLNFLQHLSGVATLTRAYVDAVAHTKATIYDTRKTTPGWRVLEKYAVRCGGGNNHRHGLYDAVLIKDNHLAGVETERLAASVFEMLNRLEPGKDREAHVRPAFVEIEADTLAQVEALLSVVGIDVILLDNFTLDEIREAVALRDSRGLSGKVALEASGGITLQTVSSVAQTGVDRVSVGAITHSAPALDLALERG